MQTFEDFFGRAPRTLTRDLVYLRPVSGWAGRRIGASALYHWYRLWSKDSPGIQGIWPAMANAIGFVSARHLPFSVMGTVEGLACFLLLFRDQSAVLARQIPGTVEARTKDGQPRFEMEALPWVFSFGHPAAGCGDLTAIKVTAPLQKSRSFLEFQDGQIRHNLSEQDLATAAAGLPMRIRTALLSDIRTLWPLFASMPTIGAPGKFPGAGTVWPDIFDSTAVAAKERQVCEAHATRLAQHILFNMPGPSEMCSVQVFIYGHLPARTRPDRPVIKVRLLGKSGYNLGPGGKDIDISDILADPGKAAPDIAPDKMVGAEFHRSKRTGQVKPPLLGTGRASGPISAHEKLSLLRQFGPVSVPKGSR